MEFLALAIVVVVFILLNKDYHKQDFRHIKVNTKQKLQGDLAEHEAGLLIALMAKVAKADGKVSELEAELLKNVFTDIALLFENDTEIREELKKIYNKEKETYVNTVEIAKKYFKLTKNQYQKRLKVLEYLLNLAFIDGEFSEAETMIIEDIALAIEIKKDDLTRLIEQFEAYYQSKKSNAKMDLAKAYSELEIEESIDNESLKKHYRKLVKQYHPDIVTGQGADQSEIETATRKLQSINEAYEIIKQHRGI